MEIIELIAKLLNEVVLFDGKEINAICKEVQVEQPREGKHSESD